VELHSHHLLKGATMRLPLKTTSGALLLCALVLAGCGSSGSDSTGQIQNVAVTSAAIDGATIPAKYTCDGRDTAPPLEWGAVPAGTGSLVLFVVGVKPEPATKTYALSVEWAVAGVNPALHRLAPGRLPSGAYVGTGSNGKRRYSICPAKGQREQYQFELYGLPAGDSVVRKFVGLPLLAKLASKKSSPANVHGALIATYKRV
jgi:phosphatidylethanolamine-binding protein (PEBP) family uncharacterized protein